MKHTILSIPWPGFTGLCAFSIVAFAWASTAYAAGPVPDAALTTSKIDVGAVHVGGVITAGLGVAVSNSRLDSMRGGFQTDTGLQISFGIQRAIYVNGNLVTSNSVNIPDIGQMNAAQASALAAVANTVNVVQIGPNNSFDPASLTHATAATVVQNSLSNQNIQSLTTLSTAVNTLDAFKNMNLQNTLQSALAGSIGH
ncbi:hypothetical protein [Rhodanobacter sp. MP7CTX1]|jgi:hypothetical protein|uniref:hypothetical protein n=1 Tax=Rhodanobacter sp. MP7CTX1 TaxID=2723084 RepID=UPI00161965F4|nr:hypothetical protein [Rhodanobacter sp. MP7CTX1]MBB6186909.1 hypothetical protein [Rhodanobacter sp. MP7CTX1]